MSEQREHRLDDKAQMSGRMGETSRIISFGLVALVFATHSSETEFSREILFRADHLLYVAAMLGCFSIVSDYLQYLCGYMSVNEALRRDAEEYTYNSASLWYRGRSVFFWAKQLFAFFGSIIATLAFVRFAIL